MNDRLFPARPILAVSAAVFRKGRVLIVRRALMPLLGHFSLPGARVEVGEAMAAALARKLMEEIGVEGEIIAFNRRKRFSTKRAEYERIASFVARWIRSEPRVRDEVGAVDWIDLAAAYLRRRRRSLAKFLARVARIEGQTAIVEK